jgi:zinc protease
MEYPLMLRRWVLTLSTLVVLWAPDLAGAQAAALPAGVSQVVAVEGITEYRLPNGLQVLLVPDDAKPTTTGWARAMRAMVRPAWRICWNT